MISKILIDMFVLHVVNKYGIIYGVKISKQNNRNVSGSKNKAKQCEHLQLFVRNRVQRSPRIQDYIRHQVWPS